MRRFFNYFLLFFAIGAGLLSGWMQLPFLNNAATIISDLFLRLLKLISLPIIFLAVTSTITGMKNFYEMRHIGRRILTYTFGTTIIAATVALALYLTLNPSQTVQQPTHDVVSQITQQTSYLSFILNIIPSNLFEAFAKGEVMSVVFIALFLSISILFLPKDQKLFLNKLFSSLFAAMIKMTGFVIKLMPIAIWAFMVLLVKDLKENYEQFNRILLYITCVVSANLIQGVIILPLFLKIKKLSPITVMRGMGQALVVAFFSKSSNATLPVTMRCAEQNLGIKQKISSFSLPLCSVINMNGCAAFILTTVLFVSSIYGLTFSAFDLISWIFIASFAAIGNAGVPMGCFFLTSAFLIGMNVPLYMMGLILPFYTLLDMFETTLNIWSDACITVAVNKDLIETESIPAIEPEDLLV